MSAIHCIRVIHFQYYQHQSYVHAYASSSRRTAHLRSHRFCLSLAEFFKWSVSLLIIFPSHFIAVALLVRALFSSNRTIHGHPHATSASFASSGTQEAHSSSTAPFNQDVAMQTTSTSSAWLPLSRNSMLPAFISALFNFKDLLFSPLFAPTKMSRPLHVSARKFRRSFFQPQQHSRSSFMYRPWVINDTHASVPLPPTDAGRLVSSSMCYVAPSLACRAQVLPLISRQVGSLFHFAYQDIGQLLCSFYSGCVPVGIMKETRALFYGQKVRQLRRASHFVLSRVNSAADFTRRSWWLANCHVISRAIFA